MSWVYRDRTHAGELLAGLLADHVIRAEVAVLALPRGGLPVAAPIARLLEAPLDILAVRKLGVPGHEELAMGAIATGGVRVLNTDVITGLGIDEATIAHVAGVEEERLTSQERRVRAGLPVVPIAGRAVILVDDGLATGSTMQAAIASARQQGAESVVVAVPVGSPSTVATLRNLADDVVCPAIPPALRAVGFAYADFSPVSDEQVRNLLLAASQRRSGPR